MPDERLKYLGIICHARKAKRFSVDADICENCQHWKPAGREPHCVYGDCALQKRVGRPRVLLRFMSCMYFKRKESE